MTDTSPGNADEDKEGESPRYPYDRYNSVHCREKKSAKQLKGAACLESKIWTDCEAE